LREGIRTSLGLGTNFGGSNPSCFISDMALARAGEALDPITIESVRFDADGESVMLGRRFSDEGVEDASDPSFMEKLDPIFRSVVLLVLLVSALVGLELELDLDSPVFEAFI